MRKDAKLFLGGLPREAQRHRAIRYKSGQRSVPRTSGFPLISLAECAPCKSITNKFFFFLYFTVQYQKAQVEK
jgi:hypothetical protein